MALNVTFSNVWGIILKEWKGVSNKTITVLIAGLIVLIFSLVFPNFVLKNLGMDYMDYAVFFITCDEISVIHA